MKETKKRKEKKNQAEKTKEEMGEAIALSYLPDHETIRRKANEIYNLRILFDIEGSPEDDWYQAEELLKDYREPAIQ